MKNNRLIFLFLVFLIGCESAKDIIISDASINQNICTDRNSVSGIAKITNVIQGSLNVNECERLNRYLIIGGDYSMPVLTTNTSGNIITFINSSVVKQADNKCNYEWIYLYTEHDISPNLGCTWTITLQLIK